MSGRRILLSVASAFAMLTNSLSVSPGSAQPLQVPESQVGNSVAPNMAVGGRPSGSNLPVVIASLRSLLCAQGA
jgi:hypothetical protein